MPQDTLRVIAHFRAKPDTVDALKNLLATLIEPTRAEDGCITYELWQNDQDPTDITFVEEWTNHAALETHLATEHIQSALGQLGDLVDAAPDIRTYTVVA